MTLHIDADTVLEPLAVHHAEPLFQLVEANRAHLRSWLTWVDHMQSPGHFERFIKGAQERAAARQESSFLLIYKNEIAGRAGIYQLDHQNQTGALGYWLGAAFQGKGLVSSACRRLLAHGFEELQLNRLEIRCGTGNLKSKAVPERLGFTLEGIVRQGEKLHDSFIDLFLFSLLKEEWQAAG
ncbi:MAG: GNAT family N-acetyltransferase [Saprospiraceae bacterium]|nr:GNAT family N-acetyltransferase [Saprospiraceae bacterium]